MCTRFFAVKRTKNVPWSIPTESAFAHRCHEARCHLSLVLNVRGAFRYHPENFLGKELGRKSRLTCHTSANNEIKTTWNSNSRVLKLCESLLWNVWVVGGGGHVFERWNNTFLYTLWLTLARVVFTERIETPSTILQTFPVIKPRWAPRRRMILNYVPGLRCIRRLIASHLTPYFLWSNT